MMSLKNKHLLYFHSLIIRIYIDIKSICAVAHKHKINKLFFDVQLDLQSFQIAVYFLIAAAKVTTQSQALH